VAGIQRAGTVYDDPAPPSACPARNRDVHPGVNSGWGRRAPSPKHAPEFARARVTQYSAIPAGKNCGHPSPRFAHSSMPDSENLTVKAVKAVKASGAQPAGTTLAVDAGVVELLERDHAVLPRCDSGDEGVRTGVGALCMHGDA
jgi:hypothetical protein